MQNFRQHAAERFGRKLGDLVEAARRLKNRFARGVVDRQPQMQPRSLCGSGFGIGNGLAQRGRHTVAPANDAQPHAFFDRMLHFGEQIFVEQPQDAVDFRDRPFPVR